MIPSPSPEARRTSGTLAYLAGNLADGVFSMVFTMILVRMISADEFGAWRQFFVVGGLLWNVAVFGLPRSLLYFYSIAPPERQGAIARRSLWLTLGFGALASLLFLAASGFIAARFDSPGIAQHAALFALLLFLSFPSFIFNPLLLGAGRRHTVAALRAFMAIFRFAALGALLWFDASLTTLLWAMNAVTLFQFVLMVAVYLRVAGPARVALWDGAAGQLRYSGNVTLQSLFGTLAQEMDKLIVSSAFPPARFASYSVGARELPLVPQIPYAITDSIAPDLSRAAIAHKTDEFLTLWHRWIRRAALIMYPVFALILFQHEQIVTILFTKEYIEGALPLLLIGCLIPLRVTSISQALLTVDDSRGLFLGSLLHLTLVTSLGFVLLSVFGLWGPALAFLISDYVQNFFFMLRIRNRLGVSLALLFPWRFLLRLLAIAIACGGVAYLSRDVYTGGSVLISFLSFASVLTVLYVAAVLSAKLADEDDISILRNIIRRR